jgi:hypothetical protein
VHYALLSIHSHNLLKWERRERKVREIRVGAEIIKKKSGAFSSSRCELA